MLDEPYWSPFQTSVHPRPCPPPFLRLVAVENSDRLLFGLHACTVLAAAAAVPSPSPPLAVGGKVVRREEGRPPRAVEPRGPLRGVDAPGGRLQTPSVHAPPEAVHVQEGHLEARLDVPHIAVAQRVEQPEDEAGSEHAAAQHGLDRPSTVEGDLNGREERDGLAQQVQKPP